MAHRDARDATRKRSWWSWFQRWCCCCCCKEDAEINKSSDISCIELSTRQDKVNTRQTGPIDAGGRKNKNQTVHQAVNAGYSEDGDEAEDSRTSSHSSSTVPVKRTRDGGMRNKAESVHQAVNAGYSSDSDEDGDEDDNTQTKISSTIPDGNERVAAPAAKRRLSSDSETERRAAVLKKILQGRERTEVDGAAVQRSTSQRGQRTTAPAVAVKRRRRRKDLFTSTEVFHRVDAHAVRAGAELKQKRVYDLKRITQSITQGTTTELETLRAIWVWLCHNIEYDVSGYLGQTRKPCTPEEVIAAGKGVCSGYAGLCLEMCREVGIECHEVSGHGKGAGYRPGQSLRNVKPDHAWNAVRLAGQWFLLDACWGAGTVDMQRRIFEKRFNDFYFLTEPEEFIDAHFPIEEKWQLLEPPMTLDEFEKRVERTAAFFTMGLSRLQPQHHKVVTVGGETNVSMGFSKPTKFIYTISQQQNLQHRHAKNSNSDLNSCGFLTYSDRGMNLKVRPLSSGTYNVEVFASPELTATTHSLVCAFAVECDVAPIAREAMPDNPFSSWGLQPTAGCLGVTGRGGESGESAEVEAGEFKLVLNTSRPLTVLAQLVHPELEPALSERCLATQVEPRRLTCHVLCPLRGFYRLSVFVGDYSKNAGAKLQNAANYLLHCRGRVVGTDELFPSNLGSSCGPGTCAEEAGLSGFSHTGAFISSDQGEFDLTFCNRRELEILAVLERDGESKTRATSRLERRTFVTYAGKVTSVGVSLPGPGIYRLGLYAKTSPGDKQFDPMCDFVVRNSCARPGPPFPHFYSDWGKGCELLEPRAGLLEPLSQVRFRLRVPQARRVCVIAEDGEWTHLEPDGSGVWKGDVSTGRAPRKLKLAASPKESGSVAIMMTFDVTQRAAEE